MNIDQYGHIFLSVIAYLPITLYLAIFSMFLATILGLFLALMRETKLKIIRLLISLYISIFRGIPTLVLLFIFYFGLPQIVPFFQNISAVNAAIIGFSLKNSAYMAEILRAALHSVPKGQVEAGIALGLKPWQIYQRIIIPQAIVNALPASGNTFISLLKETSVAFALGVTEMFAEGKILAAESLRYFDIFVMVGLIYWLVILFYSYLQSRVEKYFSFDVQR